MDFKLDNIQTNMLIYNISGIYYWVRPQILKKKNHRMCQGRFFKKNKAIIKNITVFLKKCSSQSLLL